MLKNKNIIEIRRSVTVFIVALLCCTPVMSQHDIEIYDFTEAQQTAAVKTPPDVMANEVEFRIPSTKAIENYRNDRRFKYVNKEVKPSSTELSWFDKMMFKIAKFFIKLFNNTPFRIIFIVLGVIAVMMLILRLANLDYTDLFRTKKAKTEIEDYLDEEDLNEDSFEKDIEKAISEKDYRLAVRLLFIRNLKLLSDKKIIRWNKYKTNNMYAHEITETEMRNYYVKTARVFDYVWYGEFALEEESFSMVYNDMLELHTIIGGYGTNAN